MNSVGLIMEKVLVIAPHPDDEVIGVGGTIIKHVESGAEVYVCFVCRGKEPLFRDSEVELCRTETIECHKILGVKERFYLDFPSVLLEKEDLYKINDALSFVINKVQPNVVYIPHIGDMQKDHQIVAECAMVALRPKYSHRVMHIYSYETLSETGWNTPNVSNAFIPNVYVDISNQNSKKLKAIKCYKSQISDFPNSRSVEAIESLSKYRGALIHVRAAECFMLIREIR